MVVCRDGGLALPPVLDLRKDQAAVEFFNRCLAAILLGRVYCGTITLDGLDLEFVFSIVNGHWDERRFDNEFLPASNGLRYTPATSKIRSAVSSLG